MLVIGHDRRVRRALVELLAAEPGIDVCGAVADHRAALAAANGNLHRVPQSLRALDLPRTR